MLETLPWLQRDPHYLDHVYVGADTGQPVPLGAVAPSHYGIVALNVVHDSQRVAGEIGFNLKPALSHRRRRDARKAIVAELSPPPSVQVQFEGNAKLFLQSLRPSRR